jgi:hypothetical protein
MTVYTHIPIHVRLTERWKIDPGYDADAYRVNNDLRDKYQASTDAKPETLIPEVVLEYASRFRKKGSLELLPMAAAVGMDPLDFYNVVKSYNPEKGGAFRRTRR